MQGEKNPDRLTILIYLIGQKIRGHCSQNIFPLSGVSKAFPLPRKPFGDFSTGSRIKKFFLQQGRQDGSRHAGWCGYFLTLHYLLREVDSSNVDSTFALPGLWMQTCVGVLWHTATSVGRNQLSVDQAVSVVLRSVCVISWYRRRSG